MEARENIVKSIGNRICRMLLTQGKEWLTYNLCSDKAGFITGENICIDGGMTRQMIYHGENGCVLEKGR